MSNKYILGGGISGLIHAYLNPGYKIITPEIGGKISNDFMQNTILMHESPEAVEFLNEVGISFKKITHTIKYCKGGEIRREIYQLDKIAFIKKKMQDDKFDTKDIALSTHDYYINILKFDWKELIKKLSEKSEIINETVIRITEDKIITDKTSYEYDEIVSTIPANIFWQLYYQNKELKFDSISVTFALADEAPSILSGVPFDLIYFLDKRFKYNRINAQNDKYLYEFSGRLSEEEVKKALPKHAEIIKYYVDDNGIIITNENNIPPKDIKFLGRFSTWDHKIKINDVIKESKFSYDFRNIWSRQKDFFNRVDGLSSIQTIEQKEQKTQSFLLHMMSEMSEILEELNYKTHKLHKEINVDKVKEELMDAQKYLLSMFIVWDISMEDFVKEFNRKSDICDERFNKIKKDMEKLNEKI